MGIGRSIATGPGPEPCAAAPSGLEPAPTVPAFLLYIGAVTPPSNRPLWAALGLLAVFGVLLASCPEEEETPECSAEDSALFEAQVQAATGSLNEHDPILVPSLEPAFVCEDFPNNQSGLGAVCETHEDCGHSEAICVKGITPCGGGRCTSRCRTDRECVVADIDYDYPPEMVCVIAQDQLSICLPSTCMPRIPGWDETCGPLSGEAVNDLGVGQACESQADCDPYPGSVCPPPDAPERVCSRTCEVDLDCGTKAACVCIDNHASETCMPWNFICAPAEGCAEAVRHHHCRGEGIPPRDHEMACGEHH